MGQFKRILKAIQKGKKRELLYYLNGLPDNTLENLGYSPVLLRQGLSAWPWSNDCLTSEHVRLEEHMAQEQVTMSESNACTATKVTKIGIFQRYIEQSVRVVCDKIERPIDNEAA